MSAIHDLRVLIAFVVSLDVTVPATAQQALAPAQEATKSEVAFEPEEGQDGKDVIWVPTPQSLVNRMLDMAKVTPEDYVIDLGSGDGRTVITAAKRGARALGIEYNPDMVKLSRRNAAKAGVSERAEFQEADLFETDFSKATVITMFLLPEINMKLRPKILNLKPGTRIVSNSFDMEDWEADETAEVHEDCESYCEALLWIVPAKAEGTWQLPQGELELKQSFQMLSGTLNTRGKKVPIKNAKLVGDRFSFHVGNLEYHGQVNGDSIQGTVTRRWSARRKPESQPATVE